MDSTTPNPARYFFCGVGGSGMLPLALIVKGRGFAVEGSDRALDQGRLAPKFEYLKSQGVALHAQDGGGVREGMQLVVSTAVEETVPDVQAARRFNVPIQTRAALLSTLFNQSATRIGVAGTSGKSTTTGMLAWILHVAGRNPTVMNGAVMKNFVDGAAPFASALVGGAEIFLSEIDESDGSIELYAPSLAVLNNIALDHKPMPELRALFTRFCARAETVVVNADNAEAAAIAAASGRRVLAYTVRDAAAAFAARNIVLQVAGAQFELHSPEGVFDVRLQTPGGHNVQNALAALAAASACGVPLPRAVEALAGFQGIRRRMEVVGARNGIVVIDDFGHNPDKIAATLTALHAFPGRVLAMFQPSGYGPLVLTRKELVASFAANLHADDMLFMPAPAFFGGTVTREVTSADIIADLQAKGVAAEYHAERDACAARMIELARPGDRIVIMGARDDSLTQFAAGILERL